MGRSDNRSGRAELHRLICYPIYVNEFMDGGTGKMCLTKILYTLLIRINLQTVGTDDAGRQSGMILPFIYYIFLHLTMIMLSDILSRERCKRHIDVCVLAHSRHSSCAGAISCRFCNYNNSVYNDESSTWRAALHGIFCRGLLDSYRKLVFGSIYFYSYA